MNRLIEELRRLESGPRELVPVRESMPLSVHAAVADSIPVISVDIYSVLSKLRKQLNHFRRMGKSPTKVIMGLNEFMEARDYVNRQLQGGSHFGFEIYGVPAEVNHFLDGVLLI